MSRTAPTVSATLYSGVQGDRRVKSVKLAYGATYTSATASDGGILLTPALVGLNTIDYVVLSPTFSADTIEEQLVSIGPSTSTTAGWVFALTNKDDDLETANSTAVTGVVGHAVVVGF